jgi:integrase
MSRTRAWYTPQRRTGHIKKDQLETWYKGLLAIRSQTGRDYLLTLLLTGMRREEAATMRWEDVDLARATFTIGKTKNGDPLRLPLSTQLLKILKERKQNISGQYVFPGRKEGKPIAEPKVFTAAVKEACGIKTSRHDFRRTFATIADGIDAVSFLSLKRLLNHRSAEADVTAGYVIPDPERLRPLCQRISDEIWAAMTAPGEVKE